MLFSPKSGIGNRESEFAFSLPVRDIGRAATVVEED